MDARKKLGEKVNSPGPGPILFFFFLLSLGSRRRFCRISDFFFLTSSIFFSLVLATFGRIMLIHFMNPTTGQTETLPVEASTIISEMLQLAAPLLGLDPSSCTLMINQRTLDLSSSVGTAGVNENDLLLVMPRLSSQSPSSTAARAAPVPRETGALDFRLHPSV